jgi:subtilase family serine protease
VQAEPADDRRLRVQVVNEGNKNAGGCTLKLFYHRSGKVMVRTFAVSSIPAGETLWMSINMGSPAAAASKITMRVDDPSVVKESNEGNNTHVFK